MQLVQDRLCSATLRGLRLSSGLVEIVLALRRIDANEVMQIVYKEYLGSDRSTFELASCGASRTIDFGQLTQRNRSTGVGCATRMDHPKRGSGTAGCGHEGNVC